jgi:Lon protease-like protein
MDDGRMNIIVQGARPFRLLRRIEDLPYPAADIELLEDGDDGDVDSEISATARQRYADLLARATDSRPEDSDLEGLDAFAMAASVDFGPDAKQALLELRSEQERLVKVAELFATTMKRLDYAERTAEVARSNGRVRY